MASQKIRKTKTISCLVNFVGVTLIKQKSRDVYWLLHCLSFNKLINSVHYFICFFFTFLKIETSHPIKKNQKISLNDLKVVGANLVPFFKPFGSSGGVLLFQEAPLWRDFLRSVLVLTYVRLAAKQLDWRCQFCSVREVLIVL